MDTILWVLLLLFLLGDRSAAPSPARVDAVRHRLSDVPGRLAREGHRVAAVRAVREETGASLAEALAVVHTLQPPLR